MTCLVDREILATLVLLSWLLLRHTHRAKGRDTHMATSDHAYVRRLVFSADAHFCCSDFHDAVHKHNTEDIKILSNKNKQVFSDILARPAATRQSSKLTELGKNVLPYGIDALLSWAKYASSSCFGLEGWRLRRRMWTRSLSGSPGRPRVTQGDVKSHHMHICQTWLIFSKFFFKYCQVLSSIVCQTWPIFSKYCPLSTEFIVYWHLYLQY